jgi:UDP-2,4-diacetamido-2,4,6-trideoxy-beta-L-altropyranose hydrolase
MPSIRDLPPLLVRADASETIGAGHVIRCLALVSAWQSRGGTAVFVSSCGSRTLRDRIIQSGTKFVSVAPAASTSVSVGSMASILREKTSFVVLDGYHFGPEDHDVIRAAGHGLLVIDDTAHLRRYNTEMILNQNLGATELNYVCGPETISMLGPAYALLRPEFSAARKRVRTVRECAHSVVVTMGGADSNNITLKVIEALGQLRIDSLNIRIVAGPENRHVNELREAVASLPFTAELLTDVLDMAEVMLWAEIAVTAAGSTCWELACLGVPAVSVATAENQVSAATALSRAGVTHYAGWHEDLRANDLAASIETLLFSAYRRLKMRQHARELVDGGGTARVVSALLDYACARAA